MSDLSFVFVRNDKQLSFGIVAQSLQHEEGCFLPSFELDPSEDIKTNLKNILRYKDTSDVANCVAEYGFGSIDTGINIISDHMKNMMDPITWGSEKFLFKIVITDIKKEETSKDEEEEDEDEVAAIIPSLDNQTEDMDSSNHEVETLESAVSYGLLSSRSTQLRTRCQQNKNSPAKSLAVIKTKKSPRTSKGSIYHPFADIIDKLKEQLPLYYIHIPDHLIISVNKKRINFNYWQRRLVSLMRFDQKISEHESFRSVENYQEGNIKLRFFCGFDPIRISKQETQKTLSLYIYSRKSGRLIKFEQDARNTLSITSGGTNYCQGLTCILDDFEGKIPLNPTKQDVAFTEKLNGSIFEDNIYAWTSAIVSAYYRFHLKKYQDEKKTDLTMELSTFTKVINDRFHCYASGSKVEAVELMPLADASLLTLNNVNWSKTKTGKILGIIAAKTEEGGDGKDTVFKIRGNKGVGKSKKVAKGRKTSPQRKTKPTASRKRMKVEELSSGVNSSNHHKKSAKQRFVDSSEDEAGSVINDIHPDASDTNVAIVEDLRRKIDNQNQIISKLKQDFLKLQKVNETLQRENQRMFDEFEDRIDQNQSNGYHTQIEDNLELKMLMEMNNKLQHENVKLHEEILYMGNMHSKEEMKWQNEIDNMTRNQESTEKEMQLQREIEYLKKKQDALEKKLQAEKSIRVTIEEELEALEIKHRGSK